MDRPSHLSLEDVQRIADLVAGAWGTQRYAPPSGGRGWMLHAGEGLASIVRA